MVGLIILGVIVAVIVLIMLIPVGTDISYEGGSFKLSAKICGMLMQLIPKPSVDETEPEKPEKEKKPKKEKPQKEKKPMQLNFNRDEILGLVKSVLKGFGHFGKKLRVDRFLLHYVAGGKDPYDTAMTYGYVNAALSSLGPICSKRFEVKDCSVKTDVDFMAEKTSVDFGLAVTIRIGSIIHTGFKILFGALGILIRNKFRLMKEKHSTPKQEEADPGSSVNEPSDKEENNKENTQADERMNSNGQEPDR